MNNAKLIEILDPQAGKIRETVLTNSAPPSGDVSLFESNGKQMKLSEAATTYSATFPQLLRSGLRTILFEEYAKLPNTHQLWVQEVRSNKPDEVWIEGSTLGKLPIVPEGGDYPRAELDLDRSVQITNQKRGAILSISREAILFDRTNIIMQQIRDLAGAMAYTEEDDAYTVITTAGNFTRTSTGGDNDIGNNTAATTFSATGLMTALKTLRTMKDRKSGRYYGVNPTMLICGVNVEWAAKQLLLSDTLMRTHGNTSAEVYGTGVSNPLRGQITQIVVSPFQLDEDSWVLMEPRKAVVKQVVWDLELVQKTSNDDWAYFNADVLEYKVSKMYGFGMLNDRFAYYSSSTTAPAVT